MRMIYMAVLLLGGCLAVSAQTAQPAKPDKPVITRQMLEQRLAELNAGKEQAVANVNAYEGAIQECSHWLEMLEPQEQKPKPETTPEAPKKQ